MKSFPLFPVERQVFYTFYSDTNMSSPDMLLSLTQKCNVPECCWSIQAAPQMKAHQMKCQFTVTCPSDRIIPTGNMIFFCVCWSVCVFVLIADNPHIFFILSCAAILVATFSFIAVIACRPRRHNRSQVMCCNGLQRQEPAFVELSSVNDECYFISEYKNYPDFKVARCIEAT